MGSKLASDRFTDLALLSDQQVLEELGRRFDVLRKRRRIPDQELFERGGVKKDALASFKKGRNVSLLNFVKIVRGAGLLEELARLFTTEDDFSPVALTEGRTAEVPRRISKKRRAAVPGFHWKDE